MTMKNQELYQLLLRSFDEDLSPQEQQQLQKALKESAELRQKKRELEEVEALLRNADMTTTIPFFTGKVMTKIEDLHSTQALSLMDEFALSLSRIFPKVALSSLSLLLVLTAGLYLSEGNLSSNTLLGTSDISSELLVSDDDYLNDFNF